MPAFAVLLVFSSVRIRNFELEQVDIWTDNCNHPNAGARKSKQTLPLSLNIPSDILQRQKNSLHIGGIDLKWL